MPDTGSGNDTRSIVDSDCGQRSSGRILEPGELLSGRYQITKELGRGGFGVVYLAEDRQLLSKQVVVKVLLTNRSESTWSQKKFRSEMEALSRIEHPGVVALLDSGETHDGLPYLVMQYVEGRPLRAIITNQGLDLSRAANLIRQIGRALTAAHDKGVYHRDLKPENIMLRGADDDEGTVKLIDFGIATVRDSQVVSNRESTVVAGSSNYIAPEQLLGKPMLQSDIYAFAVIAHELLTGRVPFYTKTYAELFALQQRGVQVKPKDLRHDLPEQAQTLILQALSFRPEDRPARAAAFGDELAEALGIEDAFLLSTVPTTLHVGQQVSQQVLTAAASAATARNTQRQRQGRRWLLAAAILILAAVVGIAALYRKSLFGPAVQSLAVLPFTNVEGHPDLEYISQGLTDDVVNTLGRLPALQIHGRMAIPQFRKSLPDARAAGQMLKVGAVLGGTIVEKDGMLVVQAELVNTQDGRHLWGQRYQRRRSDLSAIQQDICQEVAANLRLTLTADDKRALRKRFTQNSEAEQQYQQGRFFWNRRKAEDIKTSIAYFNRAIEADPNYALPYAGLADALMTQSGSVSPKQIMPQAELAALKALNKDDDLAQAHAALGSIKLHYDWDYFEAEKEYKRAIELDPSLAQAHSWYAVCLWVMERFDDALAESRRAQALEPTSLPIRLGVARSLAMARRYDDALRQYQETLKMYPEAVGVHVEIGLIYEHKGLYNQALDEYSKVWKGPDLPDNSGILSTAGHLYAKLGRKREAGDALARLREMSRKRYVSPCEIATLQTGLGDKDAAMESLNQCYEDRSWEMIFIKLDPALDDLHGSPSYQALVKKLKL